MVADHQTSERVYAALKADLLAGIWSFERLNINTMAERYDASATPVREALLRLVGEGLLEMPISGGFAIPRLDAGRLRDLYTFSLALGVLITKHLPSRPPLCVGDLGQSRLKYPIDALVAVLAENTGNSAIIAATRSLNDSMHPIRRMEEMRLPGLEKEYSGFLEIIHQYNPARMRKILANHHRRRLSNVHKILGMAPKSQNIQNPAEFKIK